MSVTDTQPTQSDAALHYAARGFEVFPANPRTKAPLVENGMKDATTDSAQVADWWASWPDALVACRIPADQVVLDIDPRHGGDTTWAALQQSYATILSARVHRSGRGDGGAHHWFKRPPGKLSARKLHEWARRNGVGQAVGANDKWTSGIDILHHGFRYSILPPSPHPDTGLPYLWQSRDEPAEMPGFLVDLITADEEEPAPEPTPARAPLFGLGESIADWFTNHTTWNQILEPCGWTVVAGDGNSDGSKWKHPRATAASSASVKHGCLFVYTPNTDFPETEESGPHGITRFRAWGTLNHRGDLSAAARAAGELRDGPRPPGVNLADLIATPTDPKSAPASGTNLPVEFWNARPALAHIRQAAHARLVSADAVLIATLARVALLTPPCYVLPPIVGGQVSLNLFGAIVDPSGGGKSAAVTVARYLLPHHRDDIIDPILPSSGEGLIEAFFDWVTEEVDGKKLKVKRQTKVAGYAYVDEGQALLAQADRSGSTIMETIRSGWMGGDVGQHNAAEERKRWLTAHRYRLSMVMGFQLAYAASLITDSEGGTPQRFTFASATDPSVAENADADWPGPLDFDTPPTVNMTVDVDVEASIAAGIRERRIGRSSGQIVVDPLDTHIDVRKEKLAAALAILDGRRNINVDDWELAEQIDATSCAVRSQAVNYDRAAKAAARRAATEIAVERETAIDEAKLSRGLARIARKVARKVWREGPMTPANAYRAADSRDRQIAPLEDVVDLAITYGWLTIDGDHVAKGAQQP